MTEQEQERPSDQEILDFERAIKREHLSIPIVSELKDFGELQAEYVDGAKGFQTKIEHLKVTCSGMRTIRKDGNCFYRAFSWSLAETLLSHPGAPWAAPLLAKAAESKDLLSHMGYDLSLLEDFYEPFQNTLTSPEPIDVALQNLIKTFREEYLADTIVCYLRIVTAALLKRDRDLYEAFVLDTHPTLEAFISSSVEPMHVESDQIHIVAMSNVFGMDIRVANLDGSLGEMNYHDISPMDGLVHPDTPKITLLYRPGHYDVLYPK